MKAISVINGIIQAIIMIIGFKKFFAYIDAGNARIESELSDFLLIFSVVVVLGVVVVPYLLTSWTLARAERSGDYSILKSNNTSQMFISAIEIFLLVIISENTACDFLIENASAGLYEARYLAELYGIIRGYLIAMSVCSLFFAVVSSAVIHGYEDDENYKDVPSRNDDEFYNGRRHY